MKQNDDLLLLMDDSEEPIRKKAPKFVRDIKKTEEAAPEKPAAEDEKPLTEKKSEPEVQKPAAKEDQGEPEKKKKRKSKKGLVGKISLFVGTFLIFVVICVVVACYVLLNGPSTTMRDVLVLSAKQASATKWIPGLFLDDDLVREIEESSKTVTYDVVSMEEVATPDEEEVEDEWANAIDGIRLEFIQKPAFKGYMLLIKDPTRVFVGTASDFKSGKEGMRIFDVVEKYNAVCAINGGEFPDGAGGGNGGTPIGITYSQGKKVYSGHTNRTFMGLTNENKLVVSEGMTDARAKELGIRDGVCFQTGNCLITNDGENMTMHYSPNNTGRAQRTAIGQRADGTILLLVTDGRTASSLGATHNDLIDVMLEYRAVAAGKLDGGSSAMMYYRNYYDLYNIPKESLDEYGRRGLVNTYKAFTEPRKLPTFFVVGEAK